MGAEQFDPDQGHQMPPDTELGDMVAAVVWDWLPQEVRQAVQFDLTARGELAEVARGVRRGRKLIAARRRG